MIAAKIVILNVLRAFWTPDINSFVFFFWDAIKKQQLVSIYRKFKQIFGKFE